MLTELGVSATEGTLWFLPLPLPVKHLVLPLCLDVRQVIGATTPIVGVDT
jgi:hypothetical protein